MKRTFTKTFILLTALVIVCGINGFAQSQTVYVMKDGAVAFRSGVSVIDKITFDGSGSADDALVVKKTDGSPEVKILMDDIRQLSFASGSLSVEKRNGGSETFPLYDIAKITFSDMGTGIDRVVAPEGIIVYAVPGGGFAVESPSAVRSLTLYDINGRIMDRSNSSVISAGNLVPGVYLLRVETEKGVVMKKVVK